MPSPVIEHRKATYPTERQNRRAFPRWKSEFEVRFGTGKDLYPGRGFEIGEGGLAFSSDKPPALNDEINLQYKLDLVGADWVKLKAVIRHTDGRRVGAEFLNLRMSDRLKLVDYVSTLAKPDKHTFDHM